MRQTKRYYFLILALGVVIFYVFPLIFTDKLLTVALLLFINPIYSLIFSLLYTIRFGLKLYLPISIGILFLPTVFMYYAPPMMTYSVVYAAIAFFGCCLGYPVHRRYNK